MPSAGWAYLQQPRPRFRPHRSRCRSSPAIVGLFLTGQSINLMTLGGLALAIGLLVDNATVDDREHPSQPVARQAADRRDPRRRRRGRAAADRGDARHLHRLLPGRAADRAGALPVHSARHHRRAGDARLLHPVVHGGADASRASCSLAQGIARGPRGMLRRAAGRRASRAASSASATGYGRVLEGALAPSRLRARLRRRPARARPAGSPRRSAPTSSRPPMSASSSCTIARRSARGSRRPSGWCSQVESKIRDIIPRGRARHDQRHDRRAVLLQPGASCRRTTSAARTPRS